MIHLTVPRPRLGGVEPEMAGGPTEQLLQGPGALGASAIDQASLLVPHVLPETGAGLFMRLGDIGVCWKSSRHYGM